MEVTPAGIVIETRVDTPSNVELAIVVIGLFSSKVTELRGVNANASAPIDETLAGMLIDSSLDCLKDNLPILASLLVPEKTTEVSLSASKNAKFPIDSTFSGIVMELSERFD